MTLGGKLYGAELTVSGNELHVINNPNGGTDAHRYGGFNTTIRPDGFLSAEGPIENLDANSLAGVTLTGGQPIYSIAFEPIFIEMISVEFLPPPIVVGTMAPISTTKKHLADEQLSA